jgi:uncharacterized membrane protein YkoI
MKTVMTLVMGLVVASGLANEDGDPVDLLKKSGYTLSEAIAKATVIAKEGTVVAAELEEDDGKVVYSVEFAQGGRILEISLDAKTGELVEKEVEDEDESSVAKALKITLPQAIEAALQKMPGLAFEVESELEDGKVEIEVKILSDGKVYEVEVDGVTGVAGKARTKKE